MSAKSQHCLKLHARDPRTARKIFFRYSLPPNALCDHHIVVVGMYASIFWKEYVDSGSGYTMQNPSTIQFLYRKAAFSEGSTSTSVLMMN